MTALSKTAAIKAAAKSVSICGARTSWTIYGPYYYDRLTGPSTETNADSYAKAVRMAAGWKACVALALMGRLTEDAQYAVHYAEAGDVRRLVEIGLKA